MKPDHIQKITVTMLQVVSYHQRISDTSTGAVVGGGPLPEEVALGLITSDNVPGGKALTGMITAEIQVAGSVPGELWTTANNGSSDRPGNVGGTVALLVSGTTTLGEVVTTTCCCVGLSDMPLTASASSDCISIGYNSRSC